MRQDLQFGLRPNSDSERVTETCTLFLAHVYLSNVSISALVSGSFSHAFWDYYSEFYQQIKVNLDNIKYLLLTLTIRANLDEDIFNWWD